MKLIQGLLAGFGAIALATPAFAQVTVDSAIPAYAPVKGVSGTIKSVGSDSMNNEMTLWAEGFKTFYPNVQIEVEGKGSSTAPERLKPAHSMIMPGGPSFAPNQIRPSLYGSRCTG